MQRGSGHGRSQIHGPYEYGRAARKEEARELRGADRRAGIMDSLADGFESLARGLDSIFSAFDRPQRRKRRRGPRCANRDVLYLLVGDRLIDLREHPWWRPWRCGGRCERGQTLCVSCRRVNQKLAAQAEAKP